eukprot:scaffold4180_cov99-Cylindrotheca_fusiformis.AAC.15
MAPGRRKAGPMMGASVAGILNSNVQSEEDARKRVLWTFGSVLAGLFLFDISGAFVTLYLVCHYSTDDTNLSQCLGTSIQQGLPFYQKKHDHSVSNFGDFFLLALLRCVITLVLLKLGVRYGRYHVPSSSTPASGSSTADDDDREDATSDLLRLEENGGGGTDPLQEPLLAIDNTSSSAASTSTSATSNSSSWWCNYTPARFKNGTLVVMFLTSTIYQVYAGFRVSTTTHRDTQLSIIILLCLTVLWINAQGYVVRVLLEELTRQEELLFLPPEVHRHPMYYHHHQQGLAMHWCDLCRRRISNDDSNNKKNSCYRCSLCDFDVCVPCAKRKDAATVGENVLRGDRGVRVEENISTMGYFRRSLQMAKSELPLLIVSFGLLALSSVSKLLLPHFQGHIIDKVIPDENTGEYDKAGFRKYIQIYILIMLVQGAVSTLYSAIFTLVSRRLKFTIRNALLEKILAQDMAYFDGTESGRLISRLTNDLDLMMSPIQSSLSSLLSNVLILVGGMFMCFYKSYRLSMLAFVTVGPISYLWQQYALWSKGLAREMLSYWAEGNSIASQALSHVRTVKAFGCEVNVLEKYSQTNEEALHCGVKDAWGNGITSALTGYLDLGSGVLILYFGGLLVYHGELTVGELVTFQLFWNMMNNAYQSLQGLVTNFTRSAAGAEKIFSLWDSNPDIDPTQGRDIRPEEVQGNLQLKDVTFYYQMRPDNIVLKNFSLDIPAGKTIALVGRSGGGKSTIISLLLRFYDPREGRLVLDGSDYDSLQVHQLRRLFGVVTQETELFALTVEENIAYGLNKDEYTIEDVIDAAKKAYAHDFICEMKDGYQTRIGERGNRLSGGQRQRLAIARVFLRRPKIILLDEATSALDENSQEAVHKALSNLIEESNATVVLVAHRLSTVVNADSICVIDQGTVLEQGNHDELVAKGGIYASMVEKQVKKKADFLDQEQEQGSSSGMIGNTEKKSSSLDDIDSLLAGK